MTSNSRSTNQQTCVSQQCQYFVCWFSNLSMSKFRVVYDGRGYHDCNNCTSTFDLCLIGLLEILLANTHVLQAVMIWYVLHVCPTLYDPNDIASTVCGNVPNSKTHRGSCTCMCYCSVVVLSALSGLTQCGRERDEEGFGNSPASLCTLRLPARCSSRASSSPHGNRRPCSRRCSVPTRVRRKDRRRVAQQSEPSCPSA